MRAAHLEAIKNEELKNDLAAFKRFFRKKIKTHLFDLCVPKCIQFCRRTVTFSSCVISLLCVSPNYGNLQQSRTNQAFTGWAPGNPSSSTFQLFCFKCEGKHNLENCNKFKTLADGDRVAFCAKHRTCFVCLGSKPRRDHARFLIANYIIMQHYSTIRKEQPAVFRWSRPEQKQRTIRNGIQSKLSWAWWD